MSLLTNEILAVSLPWGECNFFTSKMKRFVSWCAPPVVNVQLALNLHLVPQYVLASEDKYHNNVELTNYVLTPIPPTQLRCLNKFQLARIYLVGVVHVRGGCSMNAANAPAP